VNQSLGAYLAEVERGLRGLPAGRRRLFVRELESHLRDEAEARGALTESAMAELLAEKEPPFELAFELSSHDDGDATHQRETALLAGALLGIATGGYLWIQGGWPWHLSLLFCTALGLAVGTGVSLVRPRWRRLDPHRRLLISTLFATVLAVPLGFTSLHGFNATRLMYGAFTGYLLERHAQARPAWQPVLETLAFTLLDFLTYTYLVRHRFPYQWLHEMAFNFTLVLGVLVAVQLKHVLAGRWLLLPQD